MQCKIGRVSPLETDLHVQFLQIVVLYIASGGRKIFSLSMRGFAKGIKKHCSKRWYKSSRI